MDARRYLYEPFVESVLCVTDFSPGSMNAFAHALTVAMNVRGEFIVMQTGTRHGDKEWTRIPGVREILEDWGYIKPESPRSAVFDRLALRVSKAYAPAGDYRAVIDLLAKHPVDLVVVATGEQRVASLLRPSAAEKIARQSQTMTLFVPASGKGFVSLEDGHHILKNVLIPVDHAPSPSQAVTYAMRAAVFSTEDVIHLHLLHVGDAANAPQVEMPDDRPYIAFHPMTRAGHPADEILKAASDVAADLIVMTTGGSHGFLDALRGRVSDQVVRNAQCPVLAVPLGD